jgi:hypothetical protein
MALLAEIRKELQIRERLKSVWVTAAGVHRETQTDLGLTEPWPQVRQGPRRVRQQGGVR